MTAEVPEPLIAIGATSRLEPQPKFVSATIMSPVFIFAVYSGSSPSSACLPSSTGSMMLQYLPGMITSVSTFFPYLCALPRIESSTLHSCQFQNARIGDLTGQRRGGARGGRCQEDFRFRRAHAADVIAIGRRDCALAVAERSHVAAEAGAAARRVDDATRARERRKNALLRRLHPHFLRARIDDHAKVRRNLLAFENLRDHAKIFD